MFAAKILICLCLVGCFVHVYSERYYIVNKGCTACSRRGPPFCKQWCIVTLNVGCCLETRYVCCSYREKPGVCPAQRSSPTCMQPYPYFTTRMYECRHDFNCPLGYKCCSDCCFAHKICKQMQRVTPTTPSPPRPSVVTEAKTTETTTTPTTTLSTTEFLIEVPDVTLIPTIVTVDITPTTLPDTDVVEGSGYGGNDLEEPDAAYVKGLFDDEDFTH